MNLDSEVILNTYELADLINQSNEVATYIKYKQEIETDEQIRKLRNELAKAKQLYEETERFGQYHPDFDKAKIKVDEVLSKINHHQLIKSYKKAENELNQLLYSVSSTLAGSISASIKVPRDNNLLDDPFCTTGSCNTCGIKDNCAI